MVDASRSAIIRQVPATDGGLHVTDCPGDEPALVLMHGFISLRAQRHPDFRRLLQAVGAHADQTQRRSRCSRRRHHATLRAWTVVEPCCPRYWPPTSPPMMAPEESRPGSMAHPMDPGHASTPTQTKSDYQVCQHRPRLLWDDIESILTWWQQASRPPQVTSGLTVTPHGQRLRLGCPDGLTGPARQMPRPLPRDAGKLRPAMSHR
jgi:hypothetical protein